mmetsp:Transcript_84431/g.217442  ORF Transcript_84431/g.217442 Transcript_84431/m.217442 type:complete len:213 (+) Transcript_84431:475-1113(+)
MSTVAVRCRSWAAAEVCRKAPAAPLFRAATALPSALTLACDSPFSFSKAAASFARRPRASPSVCLASLRSDVACETSLFRRSCSAWASLKLLSSCGIFVVAASTAFSRPLVLVVHWHRNLSKSSLSLLPSSATFCCIIWSMVITRRIGLAAARSRACAPLAVGALAPTRRSTSSSRGMGADRPGPERDTVLERPGAPPLPPTGGGSARAARA